MGPNEQMLKAVILSGHEISSETGVIHTKYRSAILMSAAQQSGRVRTRHLQPAWQPGQMDVLRPALRFHYCASPPKRVCSRADA